MTPQESADVNAIRRLIAHYNLSGDEAQMATDEIFAEDARLSIPGTTFVGREEIRAFFDGRMETARQDLANSRRARHQLTTCGIDITGPDTAKGNTYFLLVRLGRITQMGSYLDEYRKIGGEWRISYRDVVLHYLIDA